MNNKDFNLIEMGKAYQFRNLRIMLQKWEEDEVLNYNA